MMKPERRVQVDRAEAAGYLPHLRALIQSATVPLWWWRDSTRGGGGIRHSGTLCAIDTGVRTVCVTAAHVYTQYLSDLERYNDIECQIGSVRIKLEDYLIESNSAVDLATFDISPVLIAGSGIRVQAASSWPPDPLMNSEIVALGGYPGNLRQEQSQHVENAFASFFARVAQSSMTHSAFQLNLAESYWPDGSGGIPERSELGGMSGGPIFRYHAHPIEYLEIAGFIYEASSEYELVRGRHASCISSTGQIVNDA